MENKTFIQEVLIMNILIKAPISKIKVPDIIIVESFFFFSAMLLKKIVEINISKKNTQTKRISIIIIIASLGRQTKTYESLLVFVKLWVSECCSE